MVRQTAIRSVWIVQREIFRLLAQSEYRASQVYRGNCTVVIWKTDEMKPKKKKDEEKRNITKRAEQHQQRQQQPRNPRRGGATIETLAEQYDDVIQQMHIVAETHRPLRPHFPSRRSSNGDEIDVVVSPRLHLSAIIIGPLLKAELPIMDTVLITRSWINT